MSSKTVAKGDLAEGMIIGDLIRRGYGVALTISHDYPFDLLLIRDRGVQIERVQVKSGIIRGGALSVKPCSSNTWVSYRYTVDMVDWIAVYEPTTMACYYIPSTLLGTTGFTEMRFRLEPCKNNQLKGTRLASDFQTI